MPAPYIQHVDTPTGERYELVMAPPFSLLDSDPGRPVPAPVALVIGIRALVRASRRGWRIAVRSMTGGPVHRERVADQVAAERRIAEIASLMRAGAWR